MKTIKELINEQWQKPGVHHAGHLVAWEANALSHSLPADKGRSVARHGIKPC